MENHRRKTKKNIGVVIITTIVIIISIYRLKTFVLGYLFILIKKYTNKTVTTMNVMLLFWKF